MQPIFKSQPELPPVVLVIVLVGLIVWLVPPALHLGPLGIVVVAVCALALAFTLARRVAEGQAQRRAHATGAGQN
jgi:Flp pilus assembly protein TadB